MSTTLVSPLKHEIINDTKTVTVARSTAKDYDNAGSITSLAGLYAALDAVEQTSDVVTVRQYTTDLLGYLEGLLSGKPVMFLPEQLTEIHVADLIGEDYEVSLISKTLDHAINQCEWLIVQHVVRCERWLLNINSPEEESAEMRAIAQTIKSIDEDRRSLIARWTNMDYI